MKKVLLEQVYLQLATSLPTDALSWPIQLCSSYFAALMPELAERMTTDLFRMPSLVMLDTKAKQLEALRLVRKQAATSYKSLEEEDFRAMLNDDKGVFVDVKGIFKDRIKNIEYWSL